MAEKSRSCDRQARLWYSKAPNNCCPFYASIYLFCDRWCCLVILLCSVHKIASLKIRGDKPTCCVQVEPIQQVGISPRILCRDLGWPDYQLTLKAVCTGIWIVAGTVFILCGYCVLCPLLSWLCWQAAETFIMLFFYMLRSRINRFVSRHTKSGTKCDATDIRYDIFMHPTTIVFAWLYSCKQTSWADDQKSILLCAASKPTAQQRVVYLPADCTRLSLRKKALVVPSDIFTVINLVRPWSWQQNRFGDAAVYAVLIV